MRVVDLLRAKRDGAELSPDDIRDFVRGVTDRTIPDYQITAFLMAVFFRGLSPGELSALTTALAESGTRLDLSSITAPTADKHSTGGVGDKISLPLAPLVAACGVAVPMLSGRGLGHTGGTLDKLEAIPGYRTRLSGEEFVRIVQRVGCSIAGQSGTLAPADGVLYELRDVTATVESLPLIVSSIASKKIAAGPQAIVYDVKTGRGAFMRERTQAMRLAEQLVATTCAAGRRAVAVLTDMDTPLGRAIGNANEAAESIAVLRGEGPDDVRELTLGLGAVMLVLAGRAPSVDEAWRALEDAIANGEGFARFRAMCEAHGADVRAVDDPSLLPLAPHLVDVRAALDGVLADWDAYALGHAGIGIGAGRATREDVIDPGAGIDLVAVAGSRVARGDVIARVRGATAARAADGARAVERAAAIAKAASPRGSRLLHIVTAEGDAPWGEPAADSLLRRAASEARAARRSGPG